MQRRLSGLELEVRPAMTGYSYSKVAKPGCNSYKRFYNFTRATRASCSEQAKLASKQAKTYKLNSKYTSCDLLGKYSAVRGWYTCRAARTSTRSL